MKNQLVRYFILVISSSPVLQFDLTIKSVKLNKFRSAESIAGKISGELYLKEIFLNKYMDDPLVTKIIYETLVNYEMLYPLEADLVILEQLLLTERNQYKLKVLMVHRQHDQKITLIVADYSDITTWGLDDHNFHFTTYYSW